jgi:NAD(P)-dependent dehydrogenase (short-subunit alcohol dehydrogenase family)
LGRYAVTGANAGIGKAIAAELLGRGERVVLVCRDRGRGEAARAELGGASELLVADLANRADVVRAAAALSSEALTGVVLNAGLWPTTRRLTDEGLEEGFVVNHLATVGFALALHERLRRDSASVVAVGAGLMVVGRPALDRVRVGSDFHAVRTYADTKLTGALALRALARRWEGSGITLNVVHPGVIDTGLGLGGRWFDPLVRLVKWFWRKPADGARGPVSVALRHDVHGKWFDELVEKPWPAITDDVPLQEACLEAAESWITGPARAP